MKSNEAEITNHKEVTDDFKIINSVKPRLKTFNLYIMLISLGDFGCCNE